MDDETDVICVLEKLVFSFILKLLDKKQKKVISKNNIIEITRLYYIIEIILKNINDNIYTTLRQIFYTNPQLFISQNISNRTIGKLTQIIKKPREILNIYNSPKGIIRGNLLLKERNLSDWIDCMSIFETRGHLICPFGIIDLKIPTTVKYVLIIEKETVFFKLLQSNFIFKYGPLILITAKGFPDINTRQLIYEIQKKNKTLKFFCLTDYDAYDMDDISINNLQWISIFTPEEGIRKKALKETDFSKLSLKDIRIMDNICIKLKSNNKFGVSETNRWIEQVNNMKKSGIKYEIDAIADMEKHLDTKIKELL
ncbi:hypothetical protein YYG_00354 [Plasmodium vinckei petteri]|uniref:DNA topoisomerase (ATP-hydrolyzing) n=1 Tax=Plasmodium vinckei petteri TaxID=138298 RepID=W7ASI8_PLAVN|nr:hypothetical protein YYG_00354 [Plasmodium vinckei petteri]